MSIGSRFSKSKDEKAFTVKLEAYVNEPWAASGAYLTLLEQAKLHGLENIDSIYITVDLHVSGWTTEKRLNELEARMEQMALGELEVIGVQEAKNV